MECIVDSGPTLRGVEITWLHSSAESTLYLEDRAACTVWTILIAPASVGEGSCGGFDNCRFDKSSSSRKVTR